jgi:hypothetical protein
MNIEVGEYFVVQRGILLNDRFLSIFSSPFAASAQNQDNKEKPPRYDRSYDGMIFKAKEICGEHIAAEYVFGKDKLWIKIGDCISLNTSDIKIWPVTEKYVACFLVK